MNRIGAPAAAGIVLCVLITACGSTKNPVARATATPAPTEVEGAVVIGAQPSASPASPDASPKAGVTPRPAQQTTAPLPAEPGAAVTAFLDAVKSGDYEAQRSLTADGALALTVIRDIIRQENERRGAATESKVDVSSAPSVTSLSGDDARVNVRAVIHSRVYGPKGEVASQDTIEGPVVLRRGAQGWRLADFVYSGRALAADWYTVDARQTREGVTLFVGGLLSYKKTTAALIRLVNEEGGSTPLKFGRTILIDAGGREAVSRQVAFDSTSAPAGFIGFARVEGKARAMRAEVTRGTDGKTWTYEVTF